jgi:hypothetical protein
MRLVKLTCAQAANLVRLNAGESLPRSLIPKSVLLPLQDAGVVQLEKSGSSYVARGVPGRLADFVAQQWGIRDLLRYSLASPENRSRAALSEIAGNSKALPNRPFDGIFIRSLDNCFLAEESLHATPPGTAVLVTLAELPRLRIEAPHLIAVENAECLWHFERVTRFFPDLANLQYALVLRWHWGEPWRNWLNTWRGQFLYFPDYDPAGLKIFESEVRPQRPDVRLLVPNGLDTLLRERGDRSLFLEQERFLNMLGDDPQVAPVAQLLRSARKALEQEALLS